MTEDDWARDHHLRSLEQLWKWQTATLVTINTGAIAVAISNLNKLPQPLAILGFPIGVLFAVASGLALAWTHTIAIRGAESEIINKWGNRSFCLAILSVLLFVGSVALTLCLQKP